MATTTTSTLFIPAFGGQGTAVFDTQNQSNLATSSSAETFLTACHAALHAELATLSHKMLENVGICASDFVDKHSILDPTDERLLDNPAFCGPRLLLIHVLRYLSFVEDVFGVPGSVTPFVDALQSNLDHAVGTLGFSSGIISACVVATSPTLHSFICYAVEAYRLALWIGIRSQLYRISLSTSSPALRPWSLVLLGMNKSDVQHAVDNFNEVSSCGHVAITAVMNDTCITTSGRPNTLERFVHTLPTHGVIVRETRINALYHFPSLLHTVRDEVLGDITSRNIRFPTVADLFAPVRSTFTGELISTTSSSANLAELVVDMILIHPVNWDLVVAKAEKHLPRDSHIQLVNIGLDSSLGKGLEKAFCDRGVQGFSSVKLNELAAPPKPKQEPIAIIGMAVNMPGSRNVSDLWKLLVAGGNTIQAIPEDRFHLSDCPNLEVRTGNFIDGVDEFDHKFFNISPREAKAMDPQQRILLQVGYEALEDSGYVPNATPTFNPEKIGCYIGAATHDYIQNLRNDIGVYYSIGTLGSFLSGRLSYCLGLSGPSVVVDTACSSSTVAIYQAARALMNRDCDAALAGGVNVISSPEMFIGLDRAHFLTSSGQCKSFDASAEGYSRGEGCGIFVLKRLSDAIAENDRILGIIRGIEVNQSGNAPSITHPHGPTQEALLKQVLSGAGVEPHSVTVVEAHGTGTQAGDTNEIESIRRILAIDRKPNNPLYVTSIKANLGHLEAASGCASLAKILLMFQYNLIPQQISLKVLNPRIAPLASDNTIISTDNAPWKPENDKTPRIALVNNFGAAGSNAALLVEERLSHQAPLPSSVTGSYVFGLSTSDISSLEILRLKYIAWLESGGTDGNSLSDIAYSMTARRQLHCCRLAVTAGSRAELAKKLVSAPIVNVTGTDVTPVVFLFSGQGSQYRGMGRSLYACSHVFRRHIQECDRILASFGFPGITSIISSNDDSSLENNAEQLQPATFAVQYALAKLWVFYGIRPMAVLGHSLGEYAALVMAGVLSLKDALFIISTRAHLMLSKCTSMSTGMIAVALGPVKLQPILRSKEAFSNTSISCFNSPDNCVVSGPLTELRALKHFLEEREMTKATLLSVPYGYHSTSMLPLVDDLVTISEDIQTHPPCIPFISSVLGRVIFTSDLAFPPREYFALQCSEPVRFSDAIESFTSQLGGAGQTWLEIGPHTSTLPMLRSFPELSNSVLVGSLRRGYDAWTSFSNALATFYCGNYGIDWRRIFMDVGAPNLISIPSYPFSTQKFWVPYIGDYRGRLEAPQRTNFSFLRNWTEFPSSENGGVATFQTPIGQLKRYIEGHRVGGVPLCPASVYLEFILAAVSLTTKHLVECENDHNSIVLRRISFSKPLTWNYMDEDGADLLTATIDTAKRSFTLKSRGSHAEALHASGEYHLDSLSKTRNSFTQLLPRVIRSINHILKPGNQTPETFSTRTLYQVIFPRVVEYLKEFHTISSLAMTSDGMEATGTIKLASDCDAAKFIVHPLFLDSLMHVAGFVSNLRGGLNDAYICNQIGSVQTLPDLIHKDVSYLVYCKIVPLPDHTGLLAESYAILDAHPRALVAYVKDIRFQHVRLSGLKATLTSVSGIFPTTPSDITHIEAPLSPNPPPNIVDAVVKVIAEVCSADPKDISIDLEVERLGIDSLMLDELSYDLSKIFRGFGYPSRELSKCKTIRDVVGVVAAMVSGESRRGHSVYACSPAASSSVVSTPRTMVHTPGGSPCVKKIFAQILEVNEEDIQEDTRLSLLGLDSLSSIEAIHTLRHEYGLYVPGDLLSSPQATIRDVNSQISSLESSSFPLGLQQRSPKQGLGDPFNRMNNALYQQKSISLLQNSSSNRTPLVLIHDGSGLTASYERLKGLGRRVWGISNPRFARSEPWAGLNQMAKCYSSLIFDEIDGPVILGGWSFGGVVAFEIARILQLRSTIVKGLVLIDSPSPSSHVPLSSALIDEMLSLSSTNQNLELQKLCKSQFLQSSQLLADYSATEIPKQPCLPFVFLKSSEPYNNVSVDIEIPSWLSNDADAAASIDSWESISGGLVGMLDIPGHHFEAFNPQNIALVSTRIAESCEIIDKV